MNPARWQLIQERFESALALDGAQREAWLIEACGSDDELLRAVRRLLLAHAAPHAALAPPSSETLEGVLQPAGPVQAAGPVLANGSDLGGYRIERVVARGGMGTVYEALQEQPRRRVALKVLHDGLASERMVERFRFEAELLGRLSHPGIAQVYAAGAEDDPTTASKLPFFAMEYVAGASDLVRYAIDRGLDVRARVELFIRVCAAVQYGHEHGVIHRDLKPSNILVTGGGDPKVIDFGIAREVGADAGLTRTGEVFGTLRYMSPEQVRGEPQSGDTRSDVYSLGMVLYELLVEWPALDLDGLNLLQAAERIQQHEPATPHAARAADVPEDLSWIVMKAIAKEPDKRYGGAAELRADLERFVAHESVLAGAPSAAYRVRRFVRRHRGWVLSGAAVVAALVLGLLGTARGMFEARREAEYSRAVQGALEDFVEATDVLTYGADLRVVDRLAPFSTAIDERFGERPRVAARLHRIVSGAWLSLGDAGRARSHAERGLALSAQLDSVLEDRAWMAIVIARSLAESGEREAAQAATAAEAAFDAGEDGSNVLAMAHLAAARCDTLQSRAASAEANARRALELCRDDHPVDKALCWNDLGSAHMLQRRPEEALAAFERALELYAEAGASARLPGVREAISTALMLLERYDEALALKRASLAELEERLGAEHALVVGGRGNLALVLWRAGRLEEAEALSREVLEQVRGGGYTYQIAGQAHTNLAMMYRQAGRWSDAARELDRGLAILTQAYGPEHPEVLEYGVLRGHAQLMLGDFGGGVERMYRGVERLREVAGRGDRRTVAATTLLARAFADAEAWEDAAATAEAAFEAASAPGFEDTGARDAARREWVRVLRAQGQDDEADAYVQAWHAAAQAAGLRADGFLTW